LWLNKPRKFIISHIRAKPTIVSRVGMLCTRYRDTVNYLSNNEDYNIDPNTYAGEFFQEDGLDGTFQIDLTEAMVMKLDNERIDNDDAGDEVHNVKDLELLERLRLDNDSDDDSVPPMEIDGDYIDTRDSDDETYDPANPDHDDYF